MMDLKISVILAVFLSFYNFSISQTTVFDNFENGNVEFVKFDSLQNKLTVIPSLKNNNNTTRCWFNFGIANVDTSRALTISYEYVREYMAPNYPVYSYDQKNWHRLEAQFGKNSKQIVYKFAKDTVYFAAGYPYTYSDVLNFVDSIAQNPVVDTSTLVFSEKGRRVPLFVIRDTNSQPTDLVWIIARQHAFETTLNHTLEGMINFLISDTPKAVQMRKNTIIYVVPMMDVDNVISGASGRMQKPIDFNRDWTKNPHWKAVKKVQELISTTSQKYNYRVFLDVHSTFPGTNHPLFGMFNNYPNQETGYFSFKKFLKLYDNNSASFLQELTAGKSAYYADSYNLGTVDTNIYVADFSTTIECDWNFNNDNNPLTISELKSIGKFITETLCDFLKNN